jgi:hypothetical protein
MTQWEVKFGDRNARPIAHVSTEREILTGCLDHQDASIAGGNLLDRFQQFLPHLKVDPVVNRMIDCDPRDCGIDVKVNNSHCVTPLLGCIPRSRFWAARQSTVERSFRPWVKPLAPSSRRCSSKACF